MMILDRLSTEQRLAYEAVVKHEAGCTDSCEVQISHLPEDQPPRVIVQHTGERDRVWFWVRCLPHQGLDVELMATLKTRAAGLHPAGEQGD